MHGRTTSTSYVYIGARTDAISTSSAVGSAPSSEQKQALQQPQPCLERKTYESTAYRETRLSCPAGTYGVHLVYTRRDLLKA